MTRLARERGDTERAERWRAHVDALKMAVEREAWDGDWYRRAYFDDGTPLGSAQNEECRIDSIAQSWAVISGAGDHERRRRAMAAVEEYLVRRGDGLVLLFTPPFDKTPLDPGYIKGYLPGVRENGGQYTHGAIWSVIAFAALNEGDKAGELFAILNPINHASTRAGLHRYKVEPYVAAADIYAESSARGTRGMDLVHRARPAGCTARGWSGSWASACAARRCTWTRASPGRGAATRSPSATTPRSTSSPSGTLTASPAASRRVTLDGEACPAAAIPLVSDGKTHTIEVVLG